MKLIVKIDLLMKKELKKNNIAVGIVIAGLLIAIGTVIATAIS
jgi:uncharacterized membrane protein YjfL (UPF0719 family)